MNSAMPDDNCQTQTQRDHDLLIDIRAKVEMILMVQQNFIHRDELKPLLEREARCANVMNTFISRQEFDAVMKPVKAVVYGTVSIGGVAIVGALMGLVLIK